MRRIFLVFFFYILFLDQCADGARRNKISRVGGGNDTTIESHPYMASVHVSGRLCGGTIISQYYILTAAHCIDGSSDETYVRVGSNFYNVGGVVYNDVIRIISRKYDVLTNDYDIALVMVPNGMELGPKVQPITLASRNEKMPRVGVVIGWGQIEDGVPGGQKLRMATVPINHRSFCTLAYGAAFTSRMICAEGFGPSSCKGDSGGPLIANGKQFGIVSWGARCHQVGVPGVYTFIPELRAWIRRATGKGRHFLRMKKERQRRRRPGMYRM